MLWAGVRIFEGRQVYPPLAATGAFVWFLGCLVPSIYSEPEHRARLIAVIIVSYLALTVAELWRSRGDGLWSRWPIMVVLAVHASAIPARVPLVASIYHPGPVRTDLVLLIGFDTLLVGTCATYLLGSIAVERIAGWYRNAAMIDPLTGVSNRRAFFDQGARLVRRAAFSHRTVALLMFDLDNFKRINDEFGHHVGDLVLMAFGRIATAEVRPTDLLGRIGGEEFACLLVDTTEGNARLLAERIRARVEVTPHHIATPPLYSTVSIGVATSALGDFDLLTLLHSADRALYRAKELGRNRVVTIDTTG